MSRATEASSVFGDTPNRPAVERFSNSWQQSQQRMSYIPGKGAGGFLDHRHWGAPGSGCDENTDWKQLKDCLNRRPGERQ